MLTMGINKAVSNLFLTINHIFKIYTYVLSILVEHVYYYNIVQYVISTLYNMLLQYCTICYYKTVQYVIIIMYNMLYQHCTICYINTVQYVISTLYSIVITYCTVLI